LLRDCVEQVGGDRHRPPAVDRANQRHG
jgi:hypothetical protein